MVEPEYNQMKLPETTFPVEHVGELVGLPSDNPSDPMQFRSDAIQLDLKSIGSFLYGVNARAELEGHSELELNVLHYAAAAGKERVVAELIRLEADVNTTTSKGYTPLLTVTRFGRGC